jgi:chromosome partitioning protein
VFGQSKSSIGKKRQVAHVIVCGNEKGGSGKSTLSVHIAVALMKAGHKVASIDLDTRQRTFTRYIENRRAWSRKVGLSLELPTHFALNRAEGELVVANQDAESHDLADRIALVEHDHDFIVIDTPGSDTYLQRLAHMMADTLITPINDSFIDFDVLAKIDPDTYDIESISQYADAVRTARRERRKADNGMIDWIVVRNRLSNIQSRNEIKVEGCVSRLAAQLGFRMAAGVTERVIFRELFPIGLTALDEFEEHVLGTKPTLSHLSARQEIRQLLAALNLPLDKQSKRRSDARNTWLHMPMKPMVLPDIFVN